MNLTLCLTHDCNLACTYCYAGAKRRDTMTRHVADTALEFAIERTTETLQLGFFGGEPLMEWALLQYATEQAEAATKRSGIRLLPTVTTNATLLTEERAEWLGRTRFLRGGLHGWQPGHARYHAALRVRRILV